MFGCSVCLFWSLQLPCSYLLAHLHLQDKFRCWQHHQGPLTICPASPYVSPVKFQPYEWQCTEKKSSKIPLLLLVCFLCLEFFSRTQDTCCFPEKASPCHPSPMLSPSTPAPLLCSLSLASYKYIHQNLWQFTLPFIYGSFSPHHHVIFIFGSWCQVVDTQKDVFSEMNSEFFIVSLKFKWNLDHIQAENSLLGNSDSFLLFPGRGKWPGAKCASRSEIRGVRGEFPDLQHLLMSVV